MKEKTTRYQCPKCHKQYKTLGWYKRHCLAKHLGILPYITKEILDKRTVDQLFNKIDSLEVKIDVLLNGGIHYINIKRIKRPEVDKPTSEIQLNMDACVNELKVIFSEGLNVLGKMEDIEVGIKSETEIMEVIKRNHKEVIV